MKPFRASARAPAGWNISHIIRWEFKTRGGDQQCVDECCCWRKNYSMMDYPFHLECTHLSYGAPLSPARISPPLLCCWATHSLYMAKEKHHREDDRQGFKLGPIKSKLRRYWDKLWWSYAIAIHENEILHEHLKYNFYIFGPNLCCCMMKSFLRTAAALYNFELTISWKMLNI